MHQKMTEEYNLTWEEAKLAMKRGAIVETIIFSTPIKYKFIDNTIHLLNDRCAWVKNYNIQSFYDISGRIPWRIVELTDCDIVRHTYIKFGATCITHYERALHQETELECLDILKLNCIAKFTEQLKKDIEEKNKMHDQKDFEPKEVNFDEIYCNKFYKIISEPDEPIYNIIKIINNDVFSYDEIDKKWKPSTFIILNLRNKKFIEVEDPEKKEVSFEDAIKGMKEGKVFSFNNYEDFEDEGDESIAIKIENGIFLSYTKNHGWSEYEIELRDILNLKFIEAEDPEKREKKEISLNALGLWSNNPNSSFKLDNAADNWIIQQEWERALGTFMRLRSHPLAIKPDEKLQYSIRVCASYEALYINHWSALNDSKVGRLSPVFYSREGAEKAISDIGEENIRHMFLTFGGIYND